MPQTRSQSRSRSLETQKQPVDTHHVSENQPSTSSSTTLDVTLTRRMQRELRLLHTDATPAFAPPLNLLPQKRQIKPSARVLESGTQPTAAAHALNDSPASPLAKTPPSPHHDNAPTSACTQPPLDEHIDDGEDVTPDGCLPADYERLPHLWTSIPHSAENEWITVCSRVCQQICDADNDESLQHYMLQLLLLPRRVLNRIAGQRGAARVLRQNLHRYASRQVDPSAVADNTPDNTQHHDTRSTRARAISKATTLMKAGHKTRAVNALLQDCPVLDITDEVVSQLIELHPTSTAALPMLDEEWPSLFLKEQDVAQYSRRFYDKGAAPGPSGWTGAMLIPLLDSVVCRRGLATVFTHIINGSIPHGTLNQALRAARLIPLAPLLEFAPLLLVKSLCVWQQPLLCAMSHYAQCSHLYSLD